MRCRLDGCQGLVMVVTDRGGRSAHCVLCMRVVSLDALVELVGRVQDVYDGLDAKKPPQAKVAWQLRKAFFED